MTRPVTPLFTRTFLLLALGVAAFTLYGSLIPFELRYRPFLESLDAFVGIMTTIPRGHLSRSDVLANVLLGVPLGFALLGAARVDKRGMLPLVLWGLALLPVCVGVAVTVEFLQLYTPGRTCALSDVVAQTLGATAGMALWGIAGQRLTDGARPALAGDSAAAVRFLVAYLAVLLLVELLPLDLDPSPADWYRKFRDGRVNLVPFRDVFRRTGAARIETLIQLAAVYLPAGLLAGCVPRLLGRRIDLPLAASAAFILSVGVECLQILVRSRFTNATDAIVGAAAVIVGWAVVRGLSRRSDGVKAPVAFVIGAVWFALLSVASWQPFDPDWGLGAGRLATLDWVPLLSLEQTPALFALEAVLTKILLFVPFGVLAAAALSRHTLGGRGVGLAVLVGGAVSCSLEAGQLFLPTRFPGITDVLLGGLGSGLGAWVTGRCRVFGDGKGIRTAVPDDAGRNPRRHDPLR